MTRILSKFEDDEPTRLDSRPRQAPVADPAAWRDARTAPFLDGVPTEELEAALDSDSLKVVALERDELVSLDGRVALILRGQLAVARFSELILVEERQARARQTDDADGLKEARKRRMKVGPLMQRAEQNLATFEEGDLLETATGSERHGSLAVYTVSPVALLFVERATVDRWRRLFPFMTERFRRAGEAARLRLDATEGARGAVADFFIRYGLSVSMTLRVRRLDACFECGACEKACEERYGVKRLSLNGRVLGGLDFVDTCHTCTDARCIDPCNYDSISFDVERREILINEASCTGCTLCALACPYDAIEMHELDEAPGLVLRLNQAGALAFGDGTPRKARLRRMASKCDHCTFYDDQACISACPTGALLEVAPTDVVTHLPEALRTSALGGYDESARISPEELNRTEAFIRGLELPDLGRARAPRAQLMTSLWWALGSIASLISIAEIVLRLFLPARSIGYLLDTVVEGIDPDVALMHAGYWPGCKLAMQFGYVGTALMASGMAYVFRRRIGWLRRLGTLQAWFDWHVVSSTIGALFILFHTAAKLDNWISLAFWSMVGAVLSGFFGRYLTTWLEERRSTAFLERIELERKVSSVALQAGGVAVVTDWLAARRRRRVALRNRIGSGAPTFFRSLQVLAFVFRDGLARRSRRRSLTRRLRRLSSAKRIAKARGLAVELADRLDTLERRMELRPFIVSLFGFWKVVHVPFAIALTVLATAHIILAR